MCTGILARMALDRRHLELLRALGDHPTLRAAAASINLSPSAASRRLAEAEARVGATLSVVSGRAVELTTAGRYLADAASEAERLLDDAALTARWLDRGVERSTRLGLTFHDTLAWAYGPIADVDVIRTTDRSWVGDLADGRIDVLVDLGDTAPGVERHPLVEDHLVAVVPIGHRLHERGTAVDGPDVADLTYFAGALEPRPGFEFERLFRPSGATPTSIVLIESATAILDLVAEGHGISIQPSLTALGRDDVATLDLVEPILVSWYARTRPAPSDTITRVVSLLADALTATRADGSPTSSVP